MILSQWSQFHYVQAPEGSEQKQLIKKYLKLDVHLMQCIIKMCGRYAHLAVGWFE